MIGCLDRPTKGLVEIGGKDTAKMSENELAVLRNKTIGFVFQQYHLLPALNVLENVMLPLRYQGIDKTKRIQMAKEALKLVGLEERMLHRPFELSGGQKQRVAIARAVVTKPSIILADEPTGALDYQTSKEIMKLIERVNQTYHTTILMVTHNDAFKDIADRVIRLRDGQIRKNYKNEHKIAAKDLEW